MGARARDKQWPEHRRLWSPAEDPAACRRGRLIHRLHLARELVKGGGPRQGDEGEEAAARSGRRSCTSASPSPPPTRE
ncbi:hypothetical protein PR202_gb12953 [Eleusine coracana subsp. coracana]|uniref:Uncharacterized protein n=1 Tax=Eleusine coracana subsp. coracana TaxID=191504 RepID=A0AAV5ERC4_ELECO|nr:hypothetical protein PR202_gb12953 [Eleusine coracana subsp. coracana]